MKFEQACQSLNAYFAQHPVFRILLPLGVPLLLVCAVLQIRGSFIALGGLVNAVTYIGCFLALILVVSACNFRMAALGLALITADYLISLLRSIISYHSMNWGALLNLLLFGWLAIQAYRKSQTMS